MWQLTRMKALNLLFEIKLTAFPDFGVEEMIVTS